MNTPQMHTRIRALLDQVKSPRIERSLINQFINVANRRYYNFGADEFQVNQVLRDEMRPFVVNNFVITPVGDLFTYPANYEHEIGFAVMVNGVRRMSTEMFYNEQNPIMENAFSEPSDMQPYHIESGVGVTAYYGAGNTLGVGYLSYLTTPLDLYWSDTVLTSANALVIGQDYYVATTPVTSNSVSYNEGDVFTATATSFTGGGTLNAVQNPQLGDSCHEELCKIATVEIAASLSDVLTVQLESPGTKR